ncbi:MAG: hypothetical protein ABW068_12790 [Candidatus Thiodiazotropha sp.]
MDSPINSDNAKKRMLSIISLLVVGETRQSGAESRIKTFWQAVEILLRRHDPVLKSASKCSFTLVNRASSVNIALSQACLGEVQWPDIIWAVSGEPDLYGVLRL